jgi:hypothetical protein
LTNVATTECQHCRHDAQTDSFRGGGIGHDYKRVLVQCCHCGTHWALSYKFSADPAHGPHVNAGGWVEEAS